MTTNSYPLCDEMTFSTKKILLELAKIMYGGCPSLVIHDFNATKAGDPAYRQLDICSGGKTIMVGQCQEGLFKALKIELEKMVTARKPLKKEK